MAFVPQLPPEKRGLAGYVLLAYAFSSLLFVFREDQEREEKESGERTYYRPQAPNRDSSRCAYSSESKSLRIVLGYVRR